MSPTRPGSQCSTATKVEFVLRLLSGETPADLSRETGRPQKQLSAWRSRFLTGGEAYLDARPNPHGMEALRDAHRELSLEVAELRAENRMLARQVMLLGKDRGPVGHPLCSEAYSRALEEPGLHSFHVPEWGTYVLVRDARHNMRQAIGIKPLASLDPNCELRAGLGTLRQAGITSVSLVTDPMWCPELPVLQQAFDTCHAFRESYFVDRDIARIQFHKRHRNRINQARRVGIVREISLADHLERWLEFSRQHVIDREITQPFSPSYFEQLAELMGLRTMAVFVDDEMVTITIWVQHKDVLYFHDAASSVKGHGTGASYVAFAHAIENANCRYVFLGGSAAFHDDRVDGLARLKRGF